MNDQKCGAAHPSNAALKGPVPLPGLPDQKPSVGRVVHYVAYGTPGGEFPAGVCRAAIITEVGAIESGRPVQLASDGTQMDVGLCVLNPSGQFFNRGVRYAADKKPGTWHWPERA